MSAAVSSSVDAKMPPPPPSQGCLWNTSARREPIINPDFLMDFSLNCRAGAGAKSSPRGAKTQRALGGKSLNAARKKGGGGVVNSRIKRSCSDKSVSCGVCGAEYLRYRRDPLAPGGKYETWALPSGAQFTPGVGMFGYASVSVESRSDVTIRKSNSSPRASTRLAML